VRHVLSDVVVVEVCQDSVAGSYCAKLLADYGADVVKVEPPGGDPLRRLGVGDDTSVADGGLFLHLDTNKRSVRLDPDDPADRERLGALLAEADLVVESEHEGSLARWGFDADSLDEPLQKLTVVSVTGFGVRGPYADYRSADIVSLAFAGTMQYTHRTDQVPVKYASHAPMFACGNFAAVGALGGLMEARITGIGPRVDSAAIENLASSTFRSPSLLAYHYRGGEPDPVPRSDTDAMLIPYGIYPCKDGYVAIVTTIQQLDKMLELLDDDDLRRTFEESDVLVRPETREKIDAVLFPWLLERTRDEATAEAQKHRFPLTGVLTPEETIQQDHFHQRGFWVHADTPNGPLDFPGPMARFDEGGWSLRRLPPTLGQHDDEVFDGTNVRVTGPRVERPAATRGPLPLDGIRVVDLTAVYAGPGVTMLLADLGAEVIRVENPWVFPPTTKGYLPRPTLPPESSGRLAAGYGPRADGRPDRPYNRHSMNNVLARNKLSATIDIRRPEGLELLHRLVDVSDVFVENFKVSSLPGMGIHPRTMIDRNPGLIVLRLPPAGLAGDWSDWTGFGMQFDGLVGLLSSGGHRGSTLMEVPITFYMDGVTGPAGAFAVLAALQYRAATGRGQLVEIAQTENVIQHIGDLYMNLQLFDRPVERMGNRDPDRAPQGVYPCADERWLALSVGTDDEWRALAGVVGGEALAGDDRFRTNADRYRHHDELDEVIGAFTAERDVMVLFHELQSVGVAAGPLMGDAFATDPHVVAREWFKPLHSTDVGTWLHPGPAFQGVASAWRRGSPNLGEDNEYVYKELLGVTDDEYEGYREAQILGDDYLDKKGVPY
jgi:crotonobetainyl-CoA:carnitine CoA-transferase CaiB-like acyl-CoA transferase